MASEVWKFQDVSDKKSILRDAAVGPNDTFVLVGFTEETSNGTTAGGEDMAAIKVDVNGNILWTWQNGTSENEKATSVAVAEDGSIFMGGYREVNGDLQFIMVTLDADGAFLREWENGTDQADRADALALSGDGSIILAGNTKGDWKGTNAGASSADFAACKLDVDGTLEWIWQNGTESQDNFNSAAVGEDGSIVMAGISSGDWSGTGFGGVDFAAVKIDRDGREQWRWQSGTAKEDVIRGVTIGTGASVIMTGFTAGNWSGVNAGDRDFVAVKLDANGKEVWRWQNGTTGEDRAHEVLAGDDGSVVVVGETHGGWAGSNAGAIDFTAVKLDENGTELWRWQDGSSSNDEGRAIASSGSNAQILLAGSTNGPWAIENASGYVFAAVMLDAGDPASPAPTPLQTRAPEPLASPSAAPTSFVGTTPPAPTSFVGTTLPTGSRAPTQGPTFVFDAPSSWPVDPPTVAADELPLNSILLGVILPSFCLLLLAGAAWLYRRRSRAQLDEGPSPAVSGSGKPGRGTDSSSSQAVLLPGNAVLAHQSGPMLRHGDDSSSRPLRHEGTANDDISLASTSTMAHRRDVGEVKSTDAPVQVTDAGSHMGGEVVNESSKEGQMHGLAMPAKDGTEAPPADSGEVVGDTNDPDRYTRQGSSGGGHTPSGSSRKPVRGIGVGRAVMVAAQELARMSQIPGISEVAGLILVLMNLATDNSDIGGTSDYMIKRCRSVTILLQRAAMVLAEIGDTSEPAHLVLIEDVRDAVGDLVEIIKTYRSRGRISQVMMSTLFKRRQDEAEAVIDATISRLNLGLQVEVGHKLNKLEQGLKGGVHLKPLQSSEPPGSGPDSLVAWSLETRRMRRQRNLDMVEIPEHYVTVTDELLGKGGFGAVYIADYNGRNAAAKVVPVEHDLGEFNISLKEGTASGLKQLERADRDHEHSRRKSFLRELQAMIRLRSPHTVNVYGAITSHENRLVLVMELLPGGDLRALLKGAVGPLEENHARRIIGDICAGMCFLHHKETVHGDLKSPNVLFDGSGRAKIADFGTSKWPQLTNSTGLATYTNDKNQHAQMSYAWAAPEVLDAKGTSYASDVYSFGVVIWEVLSMKMPWANECLRNIYVRVVIKEQRLEIPGDSPADMANVINACWAAERKRRPSFNDINKWLSWE